MKTYKLTVLQLSDRYIVHIAGNFLTVGNCTYMYSTHAHTYAAKSTRIFEWDVRYTCSYFSFGIKLSTVAAPPLRKYKATIWLQFKSLL